MIAKFEKNGKLTVTAENNLENAKLFGLINGATVPLKNETQVKKTVIKRKGTKHAKHCKVEGCDFIGRGLSLHMRMGHGVDKNGKMHQTYSHATGGVLPVKMPVVKENDVYVSIDSVGDSIPKSVQTNFLGQHVIN